MAKQGRWILKNVRHDKPGVTISGAKLTFQGQEINIGSVTSKKREDISTSIYTDLGVNLYSETELPNILKNQSMTNPFCGSTLTIGNLTYKVNWVLTEKPITPEPGYINVSRNSIDALCENNSLLLITVNANVDWTIEVSQAAQSWLSVQDITDNSFRVKILDSTSNRRTGTITVKSVGAGEAPSKTITVTQPDCRPEEPSIDIDVTSIDASCSNNQAYDVNVTAKNTEWDVEITQEGGWITITNQTETGFTINIADSTVASRTATIKVKSITDGVNIIKSISVLQPDCREPEPEEPKLEISRTNINAECKNNDAIRITVTATNTDWEVVKCANCDWITISYKTATGFRITIADNISNERGGEITVRSTTPGVSIERKISVSQPNCVEPEQPYLNINTNLSSCGQDGYCIECDDKSTYIVTVDSNTEWTAATTSTWINITDIISTGFKVSFVDNADEERTGTISIWTEDRSLSRLDKALTIKQYKCPEEDIFELLDDDVMRIPCTGGTFNFRIRTNLAEELILESDDMEGDLGWISLEEVESQQENVRTIAATFDENGLSERESYITVQVNGRQDIAAITIHVIQEACEEPGTFDVDTSDIVFECLNDTRELSVSASDDVTWTATTSNDDFGIYIDGSNIGNEIVGAGNDTIYIKALVENRKTTVTISDVLTIVSSLGDEKEISLKLPPTPVLEYDGDTIFTLSKDGESKTVTLLTNFDVEITVSANWLKYTKGQLGMFADDGLDITFSAEKNEVQTSNNATVTIRSLYNGECDAPEDIVLMFTQEPADAPIPDDSYFDIVNIAGDFPYYAELGGYTHERSFMDENFYDCCADFTKGDIGGVVYLMPLRACAIQIYYDTNVDISNITYEIEHISPANPSQEWLEVVLDPKGYGWSDKDSDGELYPGNFIMVKTFDNYEGTSLYDDTYTAYVHIKNGTTGKILKTIPVKCIPGDYRAERVSASKTETGSLKTRNLELDTIVPVTGGSVDVWVYANDSAYIGDHPDDDISWNSLTFYYEDGETRLPTRRNETSDGYIDKIYDTRCNDGERFHLVIKTGPNTSYSEITKGFELASENSGYQLIDLDSYCRVTFKQEKDRVLSQTNYRISEFYTLDSGMEPIFDGDAYDYSNITGATCDGNGHTIHPRFKAIYDYTRASNPSVTLTGETMNDGMITYDETKGQNVLNPNVLEVTDINYVNGGTNWIVQNNNYVPTQNSPFEFYIRPNSGHSQTGEARTAIITITYKGCSPQATKQFRIVQNYQYVEMQEVNMKMLSGGTTGTEYVDSATANTTSNGYIVINNDYNNYIYLSGEENVTIAIMPNTSTACTLESITDQQGGHMNDGVDIDIYRPISISGSWCQLFLKNKAPSNSTYTINIMCTKADRTTKTLTLLVNVA